jgi:hypothetical protein
MSGCSAAIEEFAAKWKVNIGSSRHVPIRGAYVEKRINKPEKTRGQASYERFMARGLHFIMISVTVAEFRRIKRAVKKDLRTHTQWVKVQALKALSES